MASLNRLMIIGNVTKEIDARTTSGGTAVANFSVATNERVKKNGEWVEHVEYHDIVFFGKTAETCRDYLTRGSSVYVEGSIRKEKYVDKDGHERLSVKVLGERMQMLGGKGSKDGGKPRSGGDGSRTYDSEPVFDDTDSIPF